MRKRLICMAIAAAAVVSALACGKLYRPNQPWRTCDPASLKGADPERAPCPGSPSVSLTLDTLGDKAARPAIRNASHEHYQRTESHLEFDLHVVEFDDQGRFWNRTQVERSLAHIEQLRQQEEVVIVMFLHGWFNNADVCNGKLSCFREMLALFAAAEERYVAQALKTSGQQVRPRRIVGVFGGWRGGTIEVPVVKHLITFWGRKGAAHTIGENGAVVELIARLAGIAHPLIRSGPPVATAADRLVPRQLVDDESTFIVAGHSFGGALLFSAMGNVLNERAGQALGGTPRAIEGLADLVVLINPAVEASRFDNLRRAATNVQFAEEQLPILLTLSSERDMPNQTLFPLGQLVAFVQKAARSREQWLSMIESLGTFGLNQTHRLIADGPDPSATGRVGGCQCDAGIRGYAALLLDRLASVYARVAGTNPAEVALTSLAQADRREFVHSRLEPMQDVDPNSPFLMLHVDGKVIGGHSDIFNQRIVDFMIEFYMLNEIKREVVRERRRIRRAAVGAGAFQ